MTGAERTLCALFCAISRSLRGILLDSVENRRMDHMDVGLLKENPAYMVKGVRNLWHLRCFITPASRIRCSWLCLEGLMEAKVL